MDVSLVCRDEPLVREDGESLVDGARVLGDGRLLLLSSRGAQGREGGCGQCDSAAKRN